MAGEPVLNSVRNAVSVSDEDGFRGLLPTALKKVLEIVKAELRSVACGRYHCVPISTTFPGK